MGRGALSFFLGQAAQVVRHSVEASRIQGALQAASLPYSHAHLVDDLAEACLFLMEKFDEPGFINVGTGEDMSIKELADRIGEVVGYKGQIQFDSTKPDGTPRKLMDVSRLKQLGWKYSIHFNEGLTTLYAGMASIGK